MCPLLREQVRLLGWIAVEQVAGEDWPEIEVVGVVVMLWAVAAAGLQTLVLGMQSASESYMVVVWLLLVSMWWGV